MIPGFLLINDVTSREGTEEQEAQVQGAKCGVVNLKVNRDQDKRSSNCGKRDLSFGDKKQAQVLGTLKEDFLVLFISQENQVIK